MSTSNLTYQYEALSPWAEVDPKPLRRISSRVKELTGKKIGLFVNNKPAAQSIMNVVEEKLKEKLPSADFSYFIFNRRGEVLEMDLRADFEKWLKEVDTVILGVGD
jgi:hypothetical protein